ncbi:MAG: MFS transporter [Oscillospiraceae bacterium]|nr:MFS transporter [Oscillospiraceae bacterium]
MTELIAKVTDTVKDVKTYWRQPRPGEYVPYKEVVTLSVGWMFLLMSIQWTIAFGVGNQFTGMTLGMNNNELLIMNYVCTAIGYLTAPLNAYIIDNLRSKDGKYRVYIKLAVPSMLLTLASLWLPYEQVRDGFKLGRYFMIIMLFLIGQIQGYVQSWVQTGIQNMIHVITPNTQERTKIMAITSIIYSMGYSINNLYYPIMVDILCDNGDKYNMRYFRGAYTPVALLMPFVLIAYFGTHERLVLPKSRITKMSFTGSLRAVAGNKIFWIRSADGWNNFLEDAKGNIWEWMVYRAHIMKSSTYGLLNTISYNANFWGMLFSPWFIKKFGKKKIKIVKNILQIFLIASYFIFYKSPLAGIGMFIVYTLDRFVDTGNVIDSAIEADMRDNQQYLIGERIDGAFNLISSYAGGAIGAVTGLFIPWVYRRKGFDGNDYSVLDVYENYDENLPLDQQKLNANCVLFPLMDTLLKISMVGAAIDVLPWFAYDISETGQKSMIRAIRIRTIVEDASADMDDSAYIDGCEAIIKARKYAGKEKLAVPHRKTVTEARRQKADTDEEKKARAEAVKAAKQAIEDAKIFNEEVEIADFVMRELNRFTTEFGKKQLELCRAIVAGGPQHFYENAEYIVALANELPSSEIREERIWRRQEVRNAHQILKSASLAAKHYKNGNIIEYDPQKYEDAYNLPDETKEQAKIRRKAMKQANKERNIYALTAAPYLAAKRTLELYEGYNDIDSIISDYDDVVSTRNARLQAEREKDEALALERKYDRESKEAEKRLRKR